jgi:hypothetical protein
MGFRGEGLHTLQVLRAARSKLNSRALLRGSYFDPGMVPEATIFSA